MALATLALGHLFRDTTPSGEDKPQEVALVRLVDGVLPLEDKRKPNPIVQSKVDVIKPKPIGAHNKQLRSLRL